ncbi:MAG: redoxin family protein [Planctomycetes bacterium]|nr:redoxin family protein [Planctomycetota bacterium]
MRLLALAFTFTVGIAAAQEPKKNPFRDGTGKGVSESDATKPDPTQATKPDPVKNPPKVLRASEAGVGKLIPDVAFTDLAGKAGKLSDVKSEKLTIVAFTNTTCPLCKKYSPVLARIEKEYAAKGVSFLFVNPTATDKPDSSAFAGRYVHDTDGKLTAAFGATSTTEVIVLDAARTVVYRGAVDDQYGLGYSLDAARNKYLTAALDDALAGKLPTIAATTAPGCALEPDAAKAPAVAMTYHARIERIVQANCVECHRAGGVGPFSLDTYEDVVSHKGAIKKVVDTGTMPPWFAVHAKVEHSPFANDRSLTPTDKKDLLAFLSGDMKKGDPADAPLPRKYESGWLIGKPDATFQLPKPVAIKAEGTMPYQHIKVETDFEEDRWVQALEVQPTAREVTHHVLVFATPKGARVGGEAAGFFAVYVPGNNSLIYPDGYAKKLPKGATLHFQMHYTPNGKATTDQTKIGMVFAKQAPRHEVFVAGISNHQFTIPAGDENYRVEAKIPVPFDAKVLALFPHAHLRGKAAKYEIKTPDGKTTTLLDVPRYDFNWQLQYRFTDPVTAPRGSSISYTAWYDNSDKNPANPDPKKAVRWGPQTYEEMHLGYLEFVLDRK